MRQRPTGWEVFRPFVALSPPERRLAVGMPRRGDLQRHRPGLRHPHRGGAAPRPRHPTTSTHLATQAGPPSVRLHLRHAATTMGPAAGVDMKAISWRLRHSGPAFTSRFYGDVPPELFHAAAEATAAIVARQREARPACAVSLVVCLANSVTDLGTV